MNELARPKGEHHATWTRHARRPAPSTWHSVSTWQSSRVFVATDELDRSWFAPFSDAGYHLVFADDLDQRPLLTALQAFPQPVWVDILAIIEQVISNDSSGD